MEFNPKKTILLSVYIIVGLWTTYTFFKASKTDEVVFSIGAGTKEISFVKSLIEEFEARNPALRKSRGSPILNNQYLTFNA